MKMLIVQQMTPVSALCEGRCRLLPQMPLPAAICPMTRAAGGNRSRGEQREAERGEDDGATLLPNPALAEQNVRAMREGFRFICWTKTLLISTSRELKTLAVLHCLDKSVFVSQIGHIIVWFLRGISEAELRRVETVAYVNCV